MIRQNKAENQNLQARLRFLASFTDDYVIQGYSIGNLAKKYDLQQSTVIRIIEEHQLESKRLELENMTVARYCGLS